MAVSFNTIPQKIYTPLFYAEVDNSAANTTTDSMQALLIGPMLTTGTATASEVTYVSSAEQAAKLFGAGSLLHRMVKAYRDQDGSGTLYCMPLADPGSGVGIIGRVQVEPHHEFARFLIVENLGTLSHPVFVQVVARLVGGGQGQALVFPVHAIGG